MDILESLFQWLMGVIRGFAQTAWNVVLAPLSSDAVYARGFFWGFISAGVVGLLFTVLRFLWNDVLQFFSSSKGPSAPGKGPSPMDKSAGCAISTVVLGILVLCLLAFLVNLLLQVR